MTPEEQGPLGGFARPPHRSSPHTDGLQPQKDTHLHMRREESQVWIYSGVISNIQPKFSDGSVDNIP